MDSVLTDIILQDRKIAYLITDQNLNIASTGGTLEILQHNVNDLTGIPIVQLIPELTGIEILLQDVLAGDLPRLELPLINRQINDGETNYLTFVFLPMCDKENNIPGVLCIADDQTEIGEYQQRLTQRRNEISLVKNQLARQNDELAIANAELTRINEIRSRLVSVAAHELRTPLTSINGYVEVILDEDLGPVPETQRDYLKIVQNSTSRLISITSNLLDITRIEAERIELSLQPADLLEVLESVFQEAKPLVNTKNQQLTLNVSIDSTVILCDKVRVAQILNNLISNANKYTADGGSIVVELLPANDEGFLLISVADNGVGIHMEDQDKLYTPFYRTEQASQMAVSGVGLGLYIIRSLVEFHGGRVWVDSKPNRGSTFYVTLPLAS